MDPWDLSIIFSFSWTDTGINMRLSHFQWSMMTSSNGNIFRITWLLAICGGEFTGHRWILRTKASDADLWCFLWSAPKKRLSKQSRGWWFETSSRSLWRHCNVIMKARSLCIYWWIGVIRPYWIATAITKYTIWFCCKRAALVLAIL